MKSIVTLSLALVALGWAAAPADAFGRRNRGCESNCADACAPTCCAAPAPAPAPAPTFEEKEVTCYRPEWKERTVEYTVNRMVTRQEKVIEKVTEMVPSWTDKKVQQTCYNRVAKVVERPVTRCRMVPVCVTDPCTGCTRTCCQRETYTEMVKCTVWECVPVTKEVVVKVCNWNKVIKDVECVRCVCECKPEKVSRVEKYCEMIPYKTKVKVPVCAPCQTCAASCGSSCDSGCGHRLCGHRRGGLFHRGHGGCGESVCCN
jgi:hypothetical protein